MHNQSCIIMRNAHLFCQINVLLLLLLLFLLIIKCKKNMSDYHNIVLILPSVITNDYFWTGGKFAYDTRHGDWSRGALFSP